MLSAPSLQMHSIPPRITEKSYRLRVSNRTMVGISEPPRFACVASGPKASNHRVMKPSNRNRRLSWSVRNTSRTQSLSRSEIGLDANRHIQLLSERTEGKCFLDIPSHRAHQALIPPMRAHASNRLPGVGLSTGRSKICGSVHSHGIEQVGIKASGHTTNTRPSYGRNHRKWSIE